MISHWISSYHNGSSNRPHIKIIMHVDEQMGWKTIRSQCWWKPLRLMTELRFFLCHSFQAASLTPETWLPPWPKRVGNRSHMMARGTFLALFIPTVCQIITTLNLLYPWLGQREPHPFDDTITYPPFSQRQASQQRQQLWRKGWEYIGQSQWPQLLRVRGRCGVSDVFTMKT